MGVDVARGAVDPERNLKLVAGQVVVDGRAMVAADEAPRALVALLPVVGHVDDDGLFLLKTPDNLVYDGVVVEAGVVVLAQHLALPVGQFGPFVLVAGRPEAGAVARIALLVVDMLAQQMEDREAVGLDPAFLLEAVVALEQPVVEGVERFVAQVELLFAQRRVVEKEAAAEVVDRLIGLGEELVGEECHLIARLSEQFGEERIVAPFPFLAHDVRGEHVLEYETREIPARDDVAELDQSAALLQLHLARGGVHEVAVLLRMVLAVALSDDQHDVGRAERAAVHRDLVGRLDELDDLSGGQRVGVEAEDQSADGRVEHGVVLLGERVLHLPYRLAAHQLDGGSLVGPTAHAAPQQQQTAERARSLPEGPVEPYAGQRQPLETGQIIKEKVDDDEQ